MKLSTSSNEIIIQENTHIFYDKFLICKSGNLQNPLVCHLLLWLSTRALPRMLPPSRPHEDMRRSGHFDDAIHATFWVRYIDSLALSWFQQPAVELFCWRVYTINQQAKIWNTRNRLRNLFVFVFSASWWVFFKEEKTLENYFASLHGNIGNLLWDLLSHLLGDASSTWESIPTQWCLLRDGDG